MLCYKQLKPFLSTRAVDVGGVKIIKIKEYNKYRGIIELCGNLKSYDLFLTTFVESI